MHVQLCHCHFHVCGENVTFYQHVRSIANL